MFQALVAPLGTSKFVSDIFSIYYRDVVSLTTVKVLPLEQVPEILFEVSH